MIILGIETSCDETALAIIETTEKAAGEVVIKVLANEVLSQIAVHKEYGGVFPSLAKREHSKNLTPLFKKALIESGFLESRITNQPARTPEFRAGGESRTGGQNHSDVLKNIRMILGREHELLEQFLAFIPTIEKPSIDLISVTAGPGLEPALWVGINFAKALSVMWDIPVVAANHMEGHILISLLERNEELSIFQASPDLAKRDNYQFSKPEFPALALLISGGHTELVLMREPRRYEIVGKTRDDAVGEAFDKVARILGLPYPGGPQISALAEQARVRANQESRITNHELKLPRPMLRSDDLDFSFSGLKTSVLYMVKKLPSPPDENLKAEIAREFENAVTDVLTAKVRKAVEKYGAKTLILGGGVVANKHIREAFEKLAKENELALALPAIDHATDNALMIALAGYANRDSALTEKTGLLEIKANGNLHF